MAKLHILIVADDRLARAGLAALLAEQPGLVVAAQIPIADALPAALDLYQPDVVLWDMGWETTGLEQIADLHTDGAHVIALLPDDKQVAAAWASGIEGLLLRDTEAQALAAALATVAHGLAVITPALVAALKTDAPQQANAPLEPLTPRELEVLRLLAEGLPNKSIAQRLAISEHTVKFHINALMSKLGVQSRTEAVVRAMRLGIISV